MNESVKIRIIELVLHSDDEHLLEQVYSILDSNANYGKGELLDQLSEMDREETLMGLKESENPDELIDHETLMKEIRNRFGWN